MRTRYARFQRTVCNIPLITLDHFIGGRMHRDRIENMEFWKLYERDLTISESLQGFGNNIFLLFLLWQEYC